MLLDKSKHGKLSPLRRHGRGFIATIRRHRIKVTLVICIVIWTVTYYLVLWQWYSLSSDGGDTLSSTSNDNSNIASFFGKIRDTNTKTKNWFEKFSTNYQYNVQNPLFSFDNLNNARHKSISLITQNQQGNINVKQSDTKFSDLTDLIIVAGHAIYSGNDFQDCNNPNNWRLQNFQKSENHLSAFLSHIAKGIELTLQNPNAILMFSGGATRTDVGPISEAQSYWKIAKNCRYNGFMKFNLIEDRCFTEEYAMDSFQNLLFSICRFFQITGNYPSSISVITWSYKQLRLENLHRKAILYPTNQFHFIGENGNVTITDNAWNWEEKAVSSFREDLFGCTSERLANVRVIRNPYFRAIPYPHQCPDISILFQICPKLQEMQLLSQNIKLPWPNDV